MSPGPRADRPRKTNIHRKKFTREEDLRLTEAVIQYGMNNWNSVAEYVGNRTPRQVRERWINFLGRCHNPEWTPEEDDELRRLYAELGRKWSQIARRLGNKSNNSVRKRWKALTKPKSAVSNDPLDFPEGSDADDYRMDPALDPVTGWKHQL
jgi:transposase-like protein